MSVEANGTTLPTSMKQIIIREPGGPDVLQVVSAELPRPGAGEVLIRVRAAGINRPDIMQRQGIYPMPAGVTPVPGLEIAGEIVACGEGATRFALGDRVCALTNGGGYAEYCVVPETQLLPIPQGFSMEQAAALPETFFTVWANLLADQRVKPGDSVLIHGGTSGIGTTALMLCRALGITAYATAGSDEKCAAIAELGGIGINYRRDDFVAAIEKLTDGAGVDAVLDIMGGSYFNQNIEVLKKNGQLIIIGFLGGNEAEKANLMKLVLKHARVTGSAMRGRSKEEKAQIARELQQHVWPLLESGQCRPPLIYQTWALDEVTRAHQEMDSGKHIGKIVLTVG